MTQTTDVPKIEAAPDSQAATEFPANPMTEEFSGLAALAEPAKDEAHAESSKPASSRKSSGPEAEKESETDEATEQPGAEEESRGSDEEETPKADADAEAEEPRAETPAKDKKESATGSAQFTRASQLRSAYDKLLQEHNALKAQWEKGKGRDGSEEANPAFAEQVESLKQRNHVLEEEMKLLRYERSSEYRERYEKPLDEAFKATAADLVEMVVYDKDGRSRPATEQDLLAVLSAPNVVEAHRAAKRFGDMATHVLGLTRKIRELEVSRKNALDLARETASKREQELAVETQARQHKMGELFNQNRKQIFEAYPQLFKAAEDDTEGRKVIEEGQKLAELAFLGAPQLAPEQMVKIHAEVYARAVGFGYQAHRNKALQARVTKLEKELAGYRDSEPGSGRDGAGKSAQEDGDDMVSVLKGMAKYAR